MRLARTKSPLTLLRLLHQIDATRAPLHPLILQVWFRLWGAADYTGRAFSALCGILAIAVVYRIGVQAFDRRTGLWAAWLCAVSPLLVYYSREARMYMWLALLTCIAWALLFSLVRSSQPWRHILYGLCLIALVYSHPLGLLMVGALGLTSGIFRQLFQMSWGGWLYTHSAVALAAVPWLNQYLDHPPAFTTGLLPLRYLLGVPIGFIGGDFATLLLCVLLMVYGQCRIQWRPQGRARVTLKPAASFVCLLIWLIVPPTLLYLFSYISHPIFGPSRYTLFVGPAYLLLLAQGLSKLSWPLGLMVGAGGTFLSAAMLLHDVYQADRYTDWRSVAAYLNQHEPSTPVAVITTGPFSNTELETARYYFGPDRIVISWVNPSSQLISHPGPIWVSIGLQNGRLVDELPAELSTGAVVQEIVDFPRLRLIRVNVQQAPVPVKENDVGEMSRKQKQ